MSAWANAHAEGHGATNPHWGLPWYTRRTGRDSGRDAGLPRLVGARRRRRRTRKAPPGGPSRVVAGSKPPEDHAPRQGLKRTSLAALWVAAALFVVALSVLVGVMLNHAVSIARLGSATIDSADLAFAAVKLDRALSEERWEQSRAVLDVRSAASERASAERDTDDAAAHLFKLLADTDIEPFQPPIASLRGQLSQLGTVRSRCHALRTNATLESVEECRGPYTAASTTASLVASAAVRAVRTTSPHVRTMLQWTHVLDSFFDIRCARAIFGKFQDCEEFHRLVQLVSHAEAAHHGVTSICGHNQAEDGTWEGPELLAGAHELTQKVIDAMNAEVDRAAFYVLCRSRQNATVPLPAAANFSGLDRWLPYLNRGADSIYSNVAALRDLAKEDAADERRTAGELTLEAVLPAMCASVVVTVLIYNTMHTERKRVVRDHVEQVMRRAGINYTLHNVRNPLHQILGVHQLLRDRARNVGDDMSCSLLDDLERVAHDMTVAVDFTVLQDRPFSPDHPLYGIPVDVVHFARDLVAQHTISAPWLSISFDVHTCAHCTILTDPNHLRKVLAAGILNSVRRTQHGSIELRVRILQPEEAERYKLPPVPGQLKFPTRWDGGVGTRSETLFGEAEADAGVTGTHSLLNRPIEATRLGSRLDYAGVEQSSEEGTGSSSGGEFSLATDSPHEQGDRSPATRWRGDTQGYTLSGTGTTGRFSHRSPARRSGPDQAPPPLPRLARSTLTEHIATRPQRMSPSGAEGKAASEEGQGEDGSASGGDDCAGSEGDDGAVELRQAPGGEGGGQVWNAASAGQDQPGVRRQTPEAMLSNVSNAPRPVEHVWMLWEVVDTGPAVTPHVALRAFSQRDHPLYEARAIVEHGFGGAIGVDNRRYSSAKARNIRRRGRVCSMRLPAETGASEQTSSSSSNTAAATPTANGSHPGAQQAIRDLAGLDTASKAQQLSRSHPEPERGGELERAEMGSAGAPAEAAGVTRGTAPAVAGEGGGAGSLHQAHDSSASDRLHSRSAHGSLVQNGTGTSASGSTTWSRLAKAVCERAPSCFGRRHEGSRFWVVVPVAWAPQRARGSNQWPRAASDDSRSTPPTVPPASPSHQTQRFGVQPPSAGRAVHAQLPGGPARGGRLATWHSAWAPCPERKSTPSRSLPPSPSATQAQAQAHTSEAPRWLEGPPSRAPHGHAMAAGATNSAQGRPLPPPDATGSMSSTAHVHGPPLSQRAMRSMPSPLPELDEGIVPQLPPLPPVHPADPSAAAGANEAANGPALPPLPTLPTAAQVPRLSTSSTGAPVPRPSWRALHIGAPTVMRRGGNSGHSPPSNESQQSTSPSYRVLYVDDETLNCKLGARALQKLNCKVTVADDGDEVLNLVREAEAAEDPYHYVMLDIVMVRLNGDEACRQLRREGYMMPIFAVTANTDAASVSQYLADGFDLVLAKPCGSGDYARALKLHPPRGLPTEAQRTPVPQGDT